MKSYDDTESFKRAMKIAGETFQKAGEIQRKAAERFEKDGVMNESEDYMDD